MRVTVLFLLFCHACLAQTGVGSTSNTTPAKEKLNAEKFRVGFQGAVGFISPTAVNNYISNTLCTSCLITGSTKISTAANLNFFVSYEPSQRWSIKIPLEYGAASKQIQDLGGAKSDNFYMSKFTTGVMATYYMPLNRMHWFFGGGLMYNHNSFNKFPDTSDNLFGQRFEIGISQQPRKSRWELFMMVDIMPTKSIDFSGVYFGTRVVI